MTFGARRFMRHRSSAPEFDIFQRFSYYVVISLRRTHYHGQRHIKSPSRWRSVARCCTAFLRLSRCVFVASYRPTTVTTGSQHFFPLLLSLPAVFVVLGNCAHGGLKTYLARPTRKEIDNHKNMSTAIHGSNVNVLSEASYDPLSAGEVTC